MKRIAILASGSGTNAQRLVEHFRASMVATVGLIGCDRPEARVVQRAWDLMVPLHLFNGAQLRDGNVQRELQQQQIDAIVLAGFMRLIPVDLVRAFPKRIINIHPALLPKYGGRGFFGHHVHAAVIKAKETESGITIHYVNDRYDEGEHIAHFRCPVLSSDTPDSLAERINALEHEHYPPVVEEVLRATSS